MTRWAEHGPFSRSQMTPASELGRDSVVRCARVSLSGSETKASVSHQDSGLELQSVLRLGALFRSCRTAYLSLLRSSVAPLWHCAERPNCDQPGAMALQAARVFFRSLTMMDVRGRTLADWRKLAFAARCRHASIADITWAQAMSLSRNCPPSAGPACEVSAEPPLFAGRAASTRPSGNAMTA